MIYLFNVSALSAGIPFVRRAHQMPLEMVVSNDVVTGNLAQGPMKEQGILSTYEPSL